MLHTRPVARDTLSTSFFDMNWNMNWIEHELLLHSMYQVSIVSRSARTLCSLSLVKEWSAFIILIVHNPRNSILEIGRIIVGNLSKFNRYKFLGRFSTYLVYLNWKYLNYVGEMACTKSEAPMHRPPLLQPNAPRVSTWSILLEKVGKPAHFRSGTRAPRNSKVSTFDGKIDKNSVWSWRARTG